MKRFRNYLTSPNFVCLVASLAIIAICGSVLRPAPEGNLAAAQNQPESSVAGSNVDFLLADMTDATVAAELHGELAGLNPVLKAILHKDFADKFVKQFVDELPQLRRDITSAAVEILTDDELQQLATFHREHPELVEKQKRFMKDGMRRCNAIGQRIGRKVGVSR